MASFSFRRCTYPHVSISLTHVPENHSDTAESMHPIMDRAAKEFYERRLEAVIAFAVGCENAIFSTGWWQEVEFHLIEGTFLRVSLCCDATFNIEVIDV